MLFHVSINVRIPHDADPDKIKQLGAQEHERAHRVSNRTSLTTAPAARPTASMAMAAKR